MKLIDVVKDSLDTNDIDYSGKEPVLQSDVLFAHVVINEREINCIINVDEQRHIMSASYFLSDNVDYSNVDEAQLFADEFNSYYNLNLGHLSVSYTGENCYEDRIRLDNLKDPQKSIAAFVIEIGEAALVAYSHLDRIANGSSTVGDELRIARKNRSNETD